MTVMISSDFLSEYELYKTDDITGLLENVKNAYINGATIDTAKYNCIGSHDDILTADAIQIAQRIIYIVDIIEGGYKL